MNAGDAYITEGTYCTVDYCDFSNLSSKAVEARDIIDSTYQKIVDLLSPQYLYLRKISIKFVPEKIAYHQGKIEIDPAYLYPGNWGCLLHEATHAVQSYPGVINRGHACWQWMEGIADYCRIRLINDIQAKKGRPENGYAEAAHFLFWLNKVYGNDKVQKLNQLLYEKNDKLLTQDAIFFTLINESYRELLYEYIKSS